MKKLLSLTVMLALALFANAENRKWDFTSWSSATVTNLAADMAANSDANWSDTEKAGGTSSAGACYWWVPAGVASMSTTVGGVETPIPELAGLDFTGYKARALAIAINYPETTLGTYAGGAYLWLGSKSQSFKIPAVKPGAKITMQVESHKPAEGRGVALSVNGTAITITEGSEKPKELTTCIWNIPTDISDAETVDVTVTQNNGCHIYSIEVNEEAAAVENAKIAYVFNSKADGYNADDDYPRMFLETDRFSNTTIDALDVAGDLSAVTADSLQGYNVVVVSSTVPADNSYASVLKQAIAYVPMLNLNANLYEAWGYGKAVTTTATSMDIDNKYQTNSLFDPSSTTNGDSWVVDGKVALFNSTPIVGVTYPADSYFADDDTIAIAGDAIAMHIHNADRNPYMFLAMPTDNIDYANEETAEDILVNAVTQLNYKKAEVPQAAAPTFTNTYKQQNTDVAIKSGVKGAKIYYTTDGTEPTDASTPYTEPINVTTANTIVSAIVYADGYNASNVAKDTVQIYETAQKPTISVEKQEGKSIVTLSTTEEGATIYYNISGSSDITASAIYSEPIELTNRTELTAFTGAANDKIQSELVTETIDIQGKQIRIDEVSHFDANAADWGNNNTAKAFYYTEGNKNGYDYYNIVDSTVTTASDGVTDSIVYVVEPANNITYYNPGKGWEFKSYGQGGLWERNTPSADIDDTNTASRYRPETALDYGATNHVITFGNVRKSNKTSNDPYSCSIQSTEAFQGPFDVVAFIGNASGSNQPKGVICVSTDTTNVDNWVSLDTIMCSAKQRYIKKHVVSYEGTDKVFVKLQAAFSSLMTYDIYVYNHGTKSEEVTGIVNVKSSDKVAAGDVVRTLVYNVDGRQLAQPTKGINIIKQVYANGAVKTKKVVVK